MRLLVLEKNERIIKIYQKIFEQTWHDVDFAWSLEEVGKRIDECSQNETNFDAVILENRDQEVEKYLTGKVKRPSLQIFYLYEKENNEKITLTQETREIIEKPLAMVKLLGKIRLSEAKQLVV